MRYKLKIIGILFFILSSLSCSDKKNEEDSSKGKANINQDLVKKIELDSIKLIKLSPRSRKITDNWMMYVALNSEIERLETYSIQDIIDNSMTIRSVTDSLSETIPEIFKTNAILARVVTLKTHSELLRENSTRIEPVLSEIEKLSAKLKFDFRNLNIQLNEVFIIQDNLGEKDTP
ncbi:hypothetical protein [Psychroflexus sp. MES1-P1E]|uniref:hypothetical protein n=1 Tax=Psychroflexus sp. MES1-P1E TaxID=2058320 RepID=UPI0021555AB8|nr:hypothetical protein [Psychroflexus sp. MES1-P1E]